jgi:hypothetical protein
MENGLRITLLWTVGAVACAERRAPKNPDSIPADREMDAFRLPADMLNHRGPLPKDDDKLSRSQWPRPGYLRVIR